MKKDFEKDFLNGAGRNELSAEDQAFIRLLREKAEDTPVPMALQPEMMMARLPEKPGKRRPQWLRVPSVRTVSRAAAVLGAFVAVLAAVSGPVRQYLENDIPMEPSSGVSESLPAEDPSSEPGALPIAPDETGGPSSGTASGPAESTETSQPSENSRPADNSASAGGTSGSGAGSSTVTGDASSGTETSDTSAGDSSESGSESGSSSSGSTLPSGDVREETTVALSPNISSTLPSNSGEDYADVYSALQRASTPQNAADQYSTAVLSAGISADGLQQEDSRTVMASNGSYFYVGSQNSMTISILEGSADSGLLAGRIQVEFVMPEISGMTPVSTAITGCYYSNGILFVVGTVSYSGSAGDSTLSAVSAYNVQNPGVPQLVAQSAQDGTMVGAALSGSYLYIFSRYYPDTTAQQNNPAAYIPILYAEGEARLPEASRIAISEAGTDSYIVATCYSSKDPGELVDCQVIQGPGKSFYLGSKGLYLFHENSRQMTTLVSGLTFGGGGFTVTSETTVGGILNTLTPPNEYNGMLRILTTSYGASNDSNLYILDQNLQLLGQAEGFLRDNILRTVRFDGSTFYYTLYGFDGQVYELDLSDPANIGRASAAPEEEEAILTVDAGGYTVRLTGQSGRTELRLSVTLSGIDRGSTVVSVPQGYDEDDITLTYLGENYVCLIYGEDYTDHVLVYQVGSGGLTEVVSTECPSVEDCRGQLRDGKFFLITAARTVSFDLTTGEQVEEIQLEQ